LREGQEPFCGQRVKTNPGTARKLGHSQFMPRYYFDSETNTDLEGAEFPNDLAAKQEASLRALNGTGHQLEHYRGGQAIVVRNEAGEEIYTVKIKR
jgi:hypothetical protein